MATLDDEVDAAYRRGRRAAALEQLRSALRTLGYDDGSLPALTARWAIEREETVAMLRLACAEHGDNDWDVMLHLADVVEKHLIRHLEGEP